MSTPDERPQAATGHLFLTLADQAGEAARRLVKVGVRPIAMRDDFAVLELRGGTHIVVRKGEVEPVVEASFDLMYDDLDATRALFEKEGFEVSEIKEGKIHRSFMAKAPEGFRLQVLDSHAGQRPV